MLVEGAFVKTLFPTRENPKHAGPLHIGYCLAVAPPQALIAYTSSQRWPSATPTPFGVRVFNAQEALALSQRPFVLHLNRLARLPLTKDWFPELQRPSRGIIAIAPARLRDELLDIVEELLRRREHLVQKLGL